MLQALGGYSVTLRELHGMTQGQVALAWARLISESTGESLENLPIHDGAVYRIEKGERWPRADRLIPFIMVLGGSFDDVIELYKLGTQATYEAGVALARERVAGQLKAAAPTLPETPEEWDAMQGTEAKEMLMRIVGAFRSALTRVQHGA